MSLRIAILGAGRIGQVHASVVSGNDDAVLAAISDPMEVAAMEAEGPAADPDEVARDVAALEAFADIPARVERARLRREARAAAEADREEELAALRHAAALPAFRDGAALVEGLRDDERGPGA